MWPPGCGLSRRGRGGARRASSLCFPGQRVDPKTGEASEAPVGIMDVYQEFDELSERFKIMKYKSKVRVKGLRSGGWASGFRAVMAAPPSCCF